MKYANYLDKANVTFGNSYLKVYNNVRNKKVASGIAERLMDSGAKVGGYVETIIRTGYDVSDLDELDREINTIRFLTKMMYKKGYVRRGAVKNVLFSALALEHALYEPIVMQKKKEQEQSKGEAEETKKAKEELSKAEKKKKAKEKIKERGRQLKAAQKEYWNAATAELKGKQEAKQEAKQGINGGNLYDEYVSDGFDDLVNDI